MNAWLEISAVSLMTTASIWFFSETLIFNALEVERIKQNTVAEATVQIGNAEPCMVDIRLAAWEAMNDMNIYRWVVACEDALK